MAEQLALEGTKMVFGSPTSLGSPVLDALLERHQIKCIVASDEHTALNTAAGYAQASGLPGVVYLTAAPGLTMAMSGLYNAFQTRIPLVVLVEQQDTQILNDDPPLSAHLCELARTVSKWTCELRTGGEISRIVRRAFHEALSPPRGPALLSLPVNILPRLSAGQLITPPQLAALGSAEASFIRKAAKILVDAESPCVIAGNEVSQYRARKEAVSLVEVLGCPAYGEPIPTGVNFPNRHPQYCGLLPLNLPQAHRLLQVHDVCLILGMQTRLSARAHEPPMISATPSVIQINVESHLTGRSAPCHLAAHADMAESLSRLRTEIQLVADPKWVANSKKRAAQTIARIAERKQKDEESLILPKGEQAISLIWLLRSLDKLRPEKSSIVSDLVAENLDIFDALTLQASAAYIASNSGVGGYALAAALGAQLASPEQAIICLTSSASIAQSPQGLGTARQLGLPVKIIAINSGENDLVGFQPFKLHLKPAMQRPAAPATKISSLASALGVTSINISTGEEVEAALQDMFNKTGPRLVEANIGSLFN
jgi:benzoylformate decarboxylase